MSRMIESVNPASEEILKTFQAFDEKQIEQVVQAAHEAFHLWRLESVERRSELLFEVARLIRQRRDALASVITKEMGKPIAQAETEIDKCEWVCRYYAEHAPGFLAAHSAPSNARVSYVQMLPLGTVLAIMPWNFPFWQLFRCAAPALAAGNTVLLKHASNVPQCALAIEDLFREAELPPGTFLNLLVPGSEVDKLIADRRITAVTLTGSDSVGSKVGAAAGRAVKKCVLELGGSDPFIVLEDADLAQAVSVGVKARFQNTGQSCIAAKRFIVAEPVYEEFRDRYVEAVNALRVGDPEHRETDIGPLAKAELRNTLKSQIRRSKRKGAKLLVGGRSPSGRGYFFPPSVLENVEPDMPIAREESFGPAAALLRARNAEEAIRLANDTPYGLGASLWSRDVERAKQWASHIEAGQVFINGMVASDPRLPFGGVKKSGYGRELSDYGIREFVNIQTVWIGPHD